MGWDVAEITNSGIFRAASRVVVTLATSDIRISFPFYLHFPSFFSRFHIAAKVYTAYAVFCLSVCSQCLCVSLCTYSSMFRSLVTHRTRRSKISRCVVYLSKRPCASCIHSFSFFLWFSINLNH